MQEKIPLVITPSRSDFSFESFQLWIETNREELKALLSKNGALLLRGFPVKDAEDFASLVQSVLQKPTDYIGEGSRTKVAEGVYTSTEAPPNFQIPLHHELSCTDSPPAYICFYCNIAPAPASGQTILGSTANITQALMDYPQVWNLFNGRTLKYISRHPPKGHIITKINKTHKTWQEAFATEDKQEVERICRQKGFEFQWSGDWIEVTRRAPATRNPDDFFDFIYWFNQAHLYHINPRGCDGWLNYMLFNAVSLTARRGLMTLNLKMALPSPERSFIRSMIPWRIMP